MKFTTLTMCATTLFLLSCGNSDKGKETKTDKDTTQTGTSEVKKEEVSAPVDSATAMKNWEMFMTPGAEHKILAKSEGSWNSEVTYWQAPGAPAQTSKSTSVNKMIMGGRYLEVSHHGNMMGMPFEGRGITGYDNGKKKFVSTWIDNMGTGFMNLEGTWDEATKSITLTGFATDPTVLKDVPYKEVFKMIDDNTQEMEMYGPGPDGKEFKSMVIKYTRKK